MSGSSSRSARTRRIRFAHDRSASLAELTAGGDLKCTLQYLGLATLRPVLVLVGGANGLEPAPALRLERLFNETLAPLLDRLGVTVIDGGTDAGVMGLIGRARAQTGGAFPLLGVAARGTVRLPGEAPKPETEHTRASLEPNHSHFLLVPGDDWGDEATWIGNAAAELARGSRCVTLVAGGGAVTRLDLRLSLNAGRLTVVLAGSGGTAELAARAPGSEGLGALGIEPKSAGLLRVVDLETAEHDLPPLLTSLLQPILGSRTEKATGSDHAPPYP